MPLTPSRFTALASNPLMLPPVQRKPAEQLEMTERPWIKIVDVKTHGNNPVIPALSFQNIRPFDGVSQQTTVLTLNGTSQLGATHTGIRSARTKNGTATPLQSLGQ